MMCMLYDTQKDIAQVNALKFDNSGGKGHNMVPIEKTCHNDHICQRWTLYCQYFKI